MLPINLIQLITTDVPKNLFRKFSFSLQFRCVFSSYHVQLQFSYLFFLLECFYFHFKISFSRAHSIKSIRIFIKKYVFKIHFAMQHQHAHIKHTKTAIYYRLEIVSSNCTKYVCYELFCINHCLVS